MQRVLRLFWFIPLALTASGTLAAELTRADVESTLKAAPAGQGARFSGQSLARLDLHDLDFTGADLSATDLSDADLRGAKLVGAKLVGAKLPRVRLNLAWIMRADFSHADLSDAVLETLVVSAGLETHPEEAASFVGANLSGAKVIARFSLDDMRGANLSHVR
ncbi:MAG: pentapeptide repeat-containing protein, partial [Bradyrhizobiaceae bacterium]|nr:pentapeptide repeat-containing protein [Bradyrhizobiaceae bacterium]